MTARQQTRAMRLATALGDDVLAFRAMRFSEGVNRLFEIDVDAEAESVDIDANALLGTNLTVSVDRDRTEEPRHFNGFVTQVVYRGVRGRRHAYRVTAAPWLWFLTLRETCRIFENKSSKEIVEEILGEHGYGDYSFQLDADPSPRPYAVQYNESDLNFITRLLVEDGVYYFFEHANGSHSLKFCDSPFSHAPEPGYETVALETERRTGSGLAEALLSWRPTFSMRPAKVSLEDFDYRNPGADLLSDGAAVGDIPTAGDIYHYPGRYASPADGRRRAKVRMAALQAGQRVARGEGTLRGVRSGAMMTVEGVDDAFAGDFMVIAADHDLTASAYETGGGAEESYSCVFSAVPTDQPYAPPQTARIPVIHGPQTATVVGSGEIDPDDLGCIFVRFPWSGDQRSCRVRVAQIWAGGGRGALFTPRVGDEVVIAFEHGDPSRPLCVGSVYNGAIKPPTDPSASPEVMTIKTLSSTGGGNFNELRFTDKAGEENVFIHAAKDLDIRAKETSRIWLGKQAHQIVGTESHLKVGAEVHEDFGADAFRTVKDAYHVKSDNLFATAATEIVLKSGKIHVKGDQNVVIEAGMSLTLKVGGNFVVIDPSGVAIKGTMVQINTGGSAGSGSGTAAEAAKPPAAAKEDEPGEKVDAASGRARTFTPQELDAHPTAAALRAAHESGAPFCEQCARAAAEAEA